VAITLEEWSFTRPGGSFEVFATDIDPPSVRTAEKGEYPLEALKKLGRSQVTRWFHVEGPTARVVADLKRRIKFRVHNLLNEWPADLSGFDVIFCRNLLIYLTSAQQQKIYEQFAGALAPRGFLVLGLTETLLGPSRRYFQCVDIRHRLYRRTDNAVNPSPDTGERQAIDG
jgi:chemotaxis protein methyltransferase CheR